MLPITGGIRPADFQSAALITAVQHHPHCALQAFDAGMRHVIGHLQNANTDESYTALQFARLLPSCRWVTCNIGQPGLWSGAESDDLVLHVASLLRSCMKATCLLQRVDWMENIEAYHLFSVMNLLEAASTNYAAAAAATAAEEENSCAGATCCRSSMPLPGSQVSNPSSSSSSSSSQLHGAQQLSTAPPVFLQLMGLCLMLFEQAVSERYYEEPNIWALATGGVDILERELSRIWFRCLQHVQWVGAQLQQLVLPGDPAKAAAALEDLQEQQQQLQQALTVAVWRLNKTAESWAAAAAAAAAPGPRPMQHGIGVGSSSSSSRRLSRGSTAGRSTFNLAEFVNCRPDAPLELAALDPSKLPAYYALPKLRLTIADVAALLRSQLPVLLHDFGGMLWSALPLPRCCGNLACANLGSVSEVKLVAGKASRCSKCHVARWVQLFEMHQLPCGSRAHFPCISSSRYVSSVCSAALPALN
jgi:hypothetical protein